MSDHLILALLWIIYCALHSWLAARSVKAKASELMGAHFKHYRLLYTLFALIGFVLIIWFQVEMRSPYLFERTTASNLSGSVISIAGLVIMGICIRKYFIHLSGVKSLLETGRLNNELQITGIHRYVRHPLYLGTFIFIWGLLLLIPVLSLLISNVVITIYTLIAIRFEEDKLVHEFGDSYREYQKNVPMILPSGRSHR